MKSKKLEARERYLTNYLNQVQPEAGNKFIANCSGRRNRLEKSLNGFMLEGHEDLFTGPGEFRNDRFIWHIVGSVFFWEESTEGFDYWANLESKIREIHE